MKSETNLKRWGFFYVLLFLIVLLATFAATGHCQVSVTPNCALGKCQFFDRNGKPLASGKVFSYDAGTTTLRPTYQDAGGIAQNTDPISLDAGGYASVWLANQSYKFCVYSSAMVLQYPCQDGVSGYLGILNFANTWTFPQTFTLPLVDLSTDNQFIIGAVGAQTTLDLPPPSTNITLHFPNTTDTMVGRLTTDNLSGKTFTDYPKVGTSFNVAVVLCAPTTDVTQTGDTTLHTIYTCTIPANALGTARQLRITVMMSVLAVAGGPVVNVNYGGTRLSPGVALTSGFVSNISRYTVVGGNTGTTNSQTWDQSMESIGGATGAYGGHVTSAIDSTVDQTVTVTFQGGATTDSVAFHRLLVELL